VKVQLALQAVAPQVYAPQSRVLAATQVPRPLQVGAGVSVALLQVDEPQLEPAA
jgi:hypothetical protein